MRVQPGRVVPDNPRAFIGVSPSITLLIAFALVQIPWLTVLSEESRAVVDFLFTQDVAEELI